MTDADVTDRDAELREWRIDVLRRLGYNRDQQQHLADLIEDGDLTLETVRKLAEKGATVDQAWWVLC